MADLQFHGYKYNIFTSLLQSKHLTEHSQRISIFTENGTKYFVMKQHVCKEH